MKIEIFKNKKCFIFPYSPMSIIFKDYLQDKGVLVKGFIDNSEINIDKVYSLTDIVDKEFDYIFIYSPNHKQTIYKQTCNVIDKNKVKVIELDILKNKYKFSNSIDYSQNLDKYFHLKSKSYKLKNKILLIGIGFIDLNIKYLYLYLKKYTNIEVFLATDNKRDIEIFKSHSINIIEYMSKEFIDIVFECSVKIVDHSPVDKLLIKCINIGYSIQLWHGVTIKMLGKQANYKALKYDVVLSTSNFVSDYSFSKLYDYKFIVEYGYPRNDIFKDDSIDMINIDLDLLKEIKNSDTRYIVYMPTYRPLGFESNPIDYKILNEFAKQNNIKFIIKMHPFVAEKLRESLDKYQDEKYQYTHIIIYSANKDIYPILKYSDMLLTDYSSVYFDYLFVNKPIIFFPYDYNEWYESANGTMIDYFSYSPGDKYYTLDTLLNGIVKNLGLDKYKEERQNMIKKIFMNHKKNSSKLISQMIKDNFFH